MYLCSSCAGNLPPFLELTLQPLEPVQIQKNKNYEILSQLSYMNLPYASITHHRKTLIQQPPQSPIADGHR